MGLFDRLKTDNQRILGDDMRDVTLYNAAGISLAGKARVTTPGMEINMQGLSVPSKKHTIGFHIDNFISLMTTNESFKNWKASFLNSQGEIVTGIFNNPMIDKTFGYVVTTLTEIKAAV
jgi:hypothetical protein